MCVRSINTIDLTDSDIPLSKAIRLTKIRHKNSGMLFLLDSGAFFKFLPLRDSLTLTKKKSTFHLLLQMVPR